MNTKYITAVIFFCALSLFSFGQKKTVNSEKSKLSWTGKAAFNTYSLTGSLKTESGEIIIKNDSIKTLNIIIDMKSLDHENKDLKTHLKGKDFFEIRAHKKATFKLIEDTEINNGKAEITGIMTIKNISKVESFTIKLNEDYSELVFDISIDRTLYGVKFNSPSFFKKMKENAIADEFKLKGNLKLE